MWVSIYFICIAKKKKKKRIKFGTLHMYAALRKPSLKRVITPSKSSLSSLSSGGWWAYGYPV